MCRPFKRAKAGEISAPASPDSISAADHQMLHTRTDAGVGAAEPSAKIVPSEAAPDPNKAAFAARSRLLEGQLYSANIMLQSLCDADRFMSS